MKKLLIFLLLMSTDSNAVIMPSASNNNAYVFQQDFENSYVDINISKIVIAIKRRHKLKAKLVNASSDLYKVDCNHVFLLYDLDCYNRVAKFNPTTLSRLLPNSSGVNHQVPEIVIIEPPVVIVPEPTTPPHEGHGDNGNPNNEHNPNVGNGDPHDNGKGNNKGPKDSHGDNGNPNQHNPNIGDGNPHNNGQNK